MRALSLLAIAAALGCDDPAVEAKISDVLEHGAVSARFECSQSVETQFAGPLPVSVVGHRMIDGSTHVSLETGSWGLSKTRFCGRSEACSGDFALSAPALSFAYFTTSVDDGELTIAPRNGTAVVLDIETACTGFNLDSF